MLFPKFVPRIVGSSDWAAAGVSTVGGMFPVTRAGGGSVTPKISVIALSNIA